MNEVPLESFAANEPNSFVDGPFGSDLKVSDYSESGVRILQLQNVGDGYFIGDNVKFTTERKALDLNRCMVRPGDLLIAKMADPLARACVVPPEIERGLIVADLMKLRLAPQHDATYVCAAINGPAFRREAERLSTGTTRIRISLSTLKRICLPERTPNEEERIGSIVRLLDETIEQTEALIAKQQQVKAGLMHDLFTRGLTPDGQLRPARVDAPGLYHETPLGWLPKEWDVLMCFEVCEKITVGIVVRPTQYYVSEGVPAFRSANVREDGIDPSDLVFISRESNELLAKSQLRAGDVISVRTGYPGTTAVVTAEFEGANCIDILISRPKPSMCSHFMAAWINSSFGKDQVLRKQGGLAQQHFNVGDLRELMLVVPDASEQQAIVARFSAINSTIAAETAHLAKLRQLKQGLMQALLTPPS